VAGQGYFVLTYTIPGEKKKTRNLGSNAEIAKVVCKLPVGTKIWIMVPSLNMGYGMEVKSPGVAY
jgi:hypothetical protein